MRCYVESDGRIYLVRRDGLLDLPTPDELPFPVERVAPLGRGPESGREPGSGCEPETWFCVPTLDSHPFAWPSKDDVPLLPDVTPRVRAAVHASMPRVVVEGICIENGRALLVLGSRGLNEGRWSLPGGFLRFAESPERGLLREIEEELGAPATILHPAGVHAKLGPNTHLHWIMFFYRFSLGGRPNPDPDEIAEARFIDIHEAAALLHDPAMTDAVRREGALSA
jgi:ADP-ribose pyrophosphatase YjhB (NUDIX family)